MPDMLIKHLQYARHAVWALFSLLNSKEVGIIFIFILKMKDFPGGTVDKNARDTGLIPGPGRFLLPQSN